MIKKTKTETYVKKNNSILDTILSQRYLLLSILVIVVIYRVAGYIVEEEFVIIDALLYLIIPGFLVSLGVYAMLKTDLIRVERNFIWFLTSFVFNFIAEQIWLVYDSVLDIDPFPSLADFFYLGAYVFLFVFLYDVIHPLRKLVSKTLILFVVIVSVTFLIPAFLISSDVYSESPIFEQIIGFSYPLLDTVLLGTVLLGLMIFFKKKNYFWLCMVAAVLVWIAADTIFINVEFTDSYYTGNPVDSLWLIAYLIFAAGVFHRVRFFEDYAKDYFTLLSIEEKATVRSRQTFAILFVIVTILVITTLSLFNFYAFESFSTNESSTIQTIIYGSMAVTIAFAAQIYIIRKKINQSQEHLASSKRISEYEIPEVEEIIPESSVLSQKITKLENASNKTHLGIIIIASILALIFIYLIFMTLVVPQIREVTLNSGPFLIENLRGDVVETWTAWKIFESEPITIGIINSAGLPPSRIKAIEEAILSEDTLKIQNSQLGKIPPDQISVFYLGWKGALQKASEEKTEFVIPTDFKIIESDLAIADINLIITDVKGTEGELGSTKAIADERQHQILKVFVTLYDADNRNNEELVAITRHEFGHAFGLLHSTAPEDLMHENFRTEFPYISQCDLDAIISLYDNQNPNQVICRG